MIGRIFLRHVRHEEGSAVLGIDLHPGFLGRGYGTDAMRVMMRLGFDNVEVAVADGSQGWPGSAPYDMILVACATPDLPVPLVEELAPEGRLIIPLGRAEDEYQDLRIYHRHDGELSSRFLFPVRFVPLRTG